ncbi:MAG: hypothetical protein AAGF20_10325 [Pseudomonadota bacterium]
MADQALDLSQIDPPRWRILVSGVVYGPYTLGQMRSFEAEGRLSPMSQVSDGEGGAFLLADEQDALAGIFHARQERAVADESHGEPEVGNHRYMVVCHARSERRALLIETLNVFGLFVEPLPMVFLLTTSAPLPELHRQISALLAYDEKVIMANTDKGRLAWQGLRDDVTQHIHTLWTKAGPDQTEGRD